jgi:multiple sugar transport system permease protein
MVSGRQDRAPSEPPPRSEGAPELPARSEGVPGSPSLRGSGEAWAFIAFPLAVLMVFTLLPTVAGLGLSFFQWDGAGPPRWVGLGNYRGMLGDEAFGPALRNTIIYVIASIAPAVVIAFLVAVAVHARWFRGKAIVRTLLFMPTIVSIVAIGFVWRWVLADHEAGALNFVLGVVGFDAEKLPSWLNERWWPFVWIVVISVWRHIGFCLVLYLAALSTVNESLYDAAEVDGAARWQVVRHITWPQVAPTTVFLLVTGIISAFQVFDIVFIMTGQQENRYTNVLNLMTYRAFTYGQLGYAAAIGAVIFSLTLVATGAQLGAARWFGRVTDVGESRSVFPRWWPGPRKRAAIELPGGGGR